MEPIEQGSLVVVKGIRDQAMLRRAWAEEDGYVLIHDEAEYAKRINGESYFEPVPFRRADVAICPQKLAQRIKARNWVAPWSEVESELRALA